MDHQSRYNKTTKLLLRLSDEELSRFTRMHALTDEAFSLALISEFWQPDEKDYREMVEMCFIHPSLSRKYGGTFLDWERIIQKLADVMDKADGMAEGGDPLGAVMVARHVLIQTCQEYENDTCPDYPTCPEWREQLCDVMDRSVKIIRKHLLDSDMIDMDTQVGLLREMIMDLKNLGKSRLYYIEKLIDEWTPYILSPQKFIRYIDNKLKKAYGLDKKRFALQKIQYLVRNGMREETEKCLLELCRYGNVRNYYADYLIKRKEYQQALALLDKNKDSFEDSYYHLDEKRLDIIRMMNDKEIKLIECRKHFLTSECRLKWYKTLKELVDDSEWKGFIKQLMEECNFHIDIEDAEAKIYINEDMREHLIKFFERQPSSDFENFKNYGKYLPVADQIKTMERYTNRIKELSVGMKSRKDYQALGHWIETLKDVTNVGNEKLVELIEWLREYHCSRPAMMQEIDYAIFHKKLN